ncbi:MAG TPA: hypothetical protein VJT84_15105 [Gaiellaceae bacterium]|nr:hypothetical protein [Gaiellaceae bacterium]
MDRLLSPHRVVVAGLLVLALAGGAVAATAPASSQPAAGPQEASGRAAISGLPTRAYWADAYAAGDDKDAELYSPGTAFNRTAGAVEITRPAGTTGRYLVRFDRLSSFLGARSTVKVSGSASNTSGTPWNCSPTSSRLVDDVIDVRCYETGTGAAANAYFQVFVTRNYNDNAFAYANQPTRTGYTPPSNSSWNPRGAIKVYRDGVGVYRVAFTGLGSVTSSTGGHVQVSAVGTAKVYCKVANWLGSPDVTVSVRCFSAAGAPIDSKFNVFFTFWNEHLAYAWGNDASSASYTPSAFYSFNPASGSITIRHRARGWYTAEWTGAQNSIVPFGTAQVTGYSTDNSQCTQDGPGEYFVDVRCFDPSGQPVDAYYTVLLGS